MNDFTTWIKQNIRFGPDEQLRLLFTLAVITAVWLIHVLLLNAVVKRIKDVQIKYRIKKTLSYILIVIVFLIMGRIWIVETDSFTTLIGLISAGIAIALKDLLVNIAGWFFIIWRRPFAVGDRIQIGMHAGDIIDIRIFQFTILEIGNWVGGDQSTGRIVHIPNGKIFVETQANYSKGFHYIWNEVSVLITFESNWKRAKTILLEIASKFQNTLARKQNKGLRKLHLNL
ncbi:MAG: mechanosensitive ion channel family protein [Bacillota bacterium]